MENQPQVAENQNKPQRKGEKTMKKYTYTIDELEGMAYVKAIHRVHKVLDNNIGLEKLNYKQDYLGYHSIAKELNIKFDENGEII